RLPQLAEALAAWMDSLTLPRAHLVANSFGCQILAEFAPRYTRLIDRLVLQGPTVDPTARTLWQQLGRLWRHARAEPHSLGWLSFEDYDAAGLRRAWASMNLGLADRVEEKLPHVQD